MWLTVPEEPGDRLWEGDLEAEDPATLAAERGDDDRADIAEAARDLPVVSIGRPEVWPLGDVLDSRHLPPMLRTKHDESSFYLVRLSCSFRPKRRDTEIDWARLSISLLADGEGQSAIAFDMHPLMVTEEVKRSVKVTLSPSLKFQEVEVGLGAAEFGLEYPEIQPIISANGAGERQPSWDFTAGRGSGLSGSKWMHLLVKAPRGMERGEARLEMAADVVRHGLRIPALARPKKTAADPLLAKLW